MPPNAKNGANGILSFLFNFPYLISTRKHMSPLNEAIKRAINHRYAPRVTANRADNFASPIPIFPLEKIAKSQMNMNPPAACATHQNAAVP